MVTLTPHKNFRANPNRCIWVQGRIDQQLIDRLSPQIAKLQDESREPITVYIDSPGGSTLHAEVLLRLLLATNQDGAEPCRLITVATSRASSAAADLLCSGAYAIAYPGSSVFFHGVRTSPDDPITVESAAAITESLRASNERYAMELAGRSYPRLVFQYVFFRARFEAFRQRAGNEDLSDLECFLGLVSERLSPKALKLVENAKKRNDRYEELVDRVFAKAGRLKRFSSPKRRAESEAALLQGIIDFELSRGLGFQEPV